MNSSQSLVLSVHDDLRARHNEKRKEPVSISGQGNATAILYSEGYFSEIDGKTANGLVRYSPAFNIKAVIDSKRQGQDAGYVLDGKHNGIPILASIEAAVKHLGEVPDYLIYGIAPAQGFYSDIDRAELLSAMSLGMNLVNGLHEFLNDDEVFSQHATDCNVHIIDVRRPRQTKKLSSFTGAIHDVKCPRIAIMGTDCAIGKRTTATVLANSLRNNGLKIVLVSTGQTGVMQGNPYSLVMDSIPAQFCAGELEAVICLAYETEKPDMIIIEGQGALGHPAYSTSSFILKGSVPHAVILQHAPNRKTRVDFDNMPMPTLASEISLIEAFSPTKVIGITLNHEGMQDSEITSAAAKYSKQYSMPVADVLLHSPKVLEKMIYSHFPQLAANQNQYDLA